MIKNTVNKTLSPSSTKEADEIDLTRLLGYLVDGRWWIVSITLIFSILGVAYVLLATPIYQANTLIQIEKKSGGINLLGNMNELLGGAQQPETNAEVELIKSRMVLGDTVAELNLDIQAAPEGHFLVERIKKIISQPELKTIQVAKFDVPYIWLNTPFSVVFQGEKQYSLIKDGVTLKQGVIGEPLIDEGISLLITEIIAVPGQAFTLMKRDKLLEIRELQSSLVISERGKNTGILSLSLEGSDPIKIRKILQHISQIYLQQNLLRKSEEAEKSLVFLKSHLVSVREELVNAEEHLNQYRQENESIDLSLEAKSVLDSMVQIEKQLGELTFKEAEIQQLYTKQHPAYLALLEKRKTLEESKERINASIQRLPQTQQQILRLTRDVQLGQEILLKLLATEQELNILKAGTISNVRIIDEAITEPEPVKPKKLLITVLAVLLGLMISVMVVLVRAFFHRGIISPEQIEELGLSVYANIPLSKDQQANLISYKKRKIGKNDALSLLAASNPTDLAIEALRSLRTSLHFAMLEAKNNIVMFTGATPDIGKSFISSNFAAVLAFSERRVLLIDADLRKGHLREYFKVNSKGGLSEYLAGQMSKEALINATEVDGLTFISSGVVPPNPSELLMHPRFEELLNWASQHYDFIIIDSPPILLVTDAAIIGRQAGTTLFVARFEVTTLKEIEFAYNRFEQNGITISGVIFNAVEARASAYYTGMSYYYQEGYGTKQK